MAGPNRSVYQLLTIKGRQGSFLTNREHVLRAAEAARRARYARAAAEAKRQGAPPPPPGRFRTSLGDISQNHHVWIYRGFKPFVEMVFDYYSLAGSPAAKPGGHVDFDLKDLGDFIYDMVFYTRFSRISAGNGAVPANALVRYCAYPGVRFYKRVAFEMFDKELDYYTSVDTMMMQQTRVPPGKREAWNRMVGQQVPLRGVVYNPTYHVEEERVFYDGPQTYKPTQPKLETLTPLEFCFNQHAENMLPSYSMPWGKKRVRVVLAETAEMVEAVEAADMSAAVALDKKALAVEEVRLYVNYVFVPDYVLQAYKESITLMQVRLHRHANRTVTQDTGHIDLTELKHPTERLFVAFRPRINDRELQNWHKFKAITRRFVEVAAIVPGAPPQLVVRSAAYDDTRDCVRDTELRLNTETVVEQMPAAMMKDYNPYKFGSFVAPEDTGVLLYPFSLFPNHLSGFVDMSAYKTKYIAYTSDAIDASNPASCHVVSDVINFLNIDAESLKATLYFQV